MDGLYNQQRCLLGGKNHRCFYESQKDSLIRKHFVFGPCEHSVMTKGESVYLGISVVRIIDEGFFLLLFSLPFYILLVFLFNYRIC